MKKGNKLRGMRPDWFKALAICLSFLLLASSLPLPVQAFGVLDTPEDAQSYEDSPAALLADDTVEDGSGLTPGTPEENQAGADPPPAAADENTDPAPAGEEEDGEDGQFQPLEVEQPLLRITAVDSNTLLLEWDAVSDATGYEIYRTTTTDNVTSLLNRVTETSYEDSGLMPAATYQYRVVADDGTEISASGSTPTGQTDLPQPPVLTVEVLGTDSLKISWTETPGSTGSELFWDTSPQGDFKSNLHTASGAEAREFIHSGLTADSTYYYKVNAWNSEWNLTSEMAQGQTLAFSLEVPDSPGGLSAQVVDLSQINISWQAVEGAESYLLYLAPTQEALADEAERSQHVVGTPGYRHSGLQPQATWWYTVAAQNSAGLSEPAQAVSATTPAEDEVPAQVTAQALAPEQVQVTWNAAPAADAYQVFRADAQDGTYSAVSDVLDVEVLNFLDETVTAGNSYWYRVKGLNQAGAHASWAAGVNTFIAVNITEATSSKLKVNWEAAAGAESYQVHRSTDGVDFSDYLGTFNTLYLENTLLQPATTYYFKVTADSGLTGIGHAATLAVSEPGKQDETVPTAPQKLQATWSSTGQAALSWQTVSNATGYKIYRADTEGGDYAQIDLSATASYTDSGLTAGQMYWYKVSAYNGQGESALSEVARIGGAAPAGLAAQPLGSTAIWLSWQNLPAAEGYQISRALEENGTYQPLATVEAGTVSYLDSSLNPETGYYYQVAALYAGQAGLAAGPCLATTTAQRSIALQAEATRNAAGVPGIQLTWADLHTVTALNAYQVYRAETAAGPYTLYQTIGTDPLASEYCDSGQDLALTAGKTYYYQVSACLLDAAGKPLYEGTPSGPVSATAYTGLTARALSDQGLKRGVRLSWDAVTGAESYVLYRSADGGQTYTTKLADLPATLTGYTDYDTTLLANQTYHYRLAALNAGNTEYSRQTAKDNAAVRVGFAAQEYAMSLPVAVKTWPTVTFEPNRGRWSDGSTESKTLDMEPGSLLVQDNPMRSGYRFQGWLTDTADATSYWLMGTNTMPEDENITLTARWRRRSSGNSSKTVVAEVVAEESAPEQAAEQTPTQETESQEDAEQEPAVSGSNTGQGGTSGSNTDGAPDEGGEDGGAGQVTIDEPAQPLSAGEEDGTIVKDGLYLGNLPLTGEGGVRLQVWISLFGLALALVCVCSLGKSSKKKPQN